MTRRYLRRERVHFQFGAYWQTIWSNRCVLDHHDEPFPVPVWIYRADWLIGSGASFRDPSDFDFFDCFDSWCCFSPPWPKQVLKHCLNCAIYRERRRKSDNWGLWVTTRSDTGYFFSSRLLYASIITKEFKRIWSKYCRIWGARKIRSKTVSIFKRELVLHYLGLYLTCWRWQYWLV